MHRHKACVLSERVVSEACSCGGVRGRRVCCVTLENYLLAIHVFILVSQIKTVRLSTLNQSEIFTFLLYVGIVCWQNMISGKCSFCKRKLKKLVSVIKQFSLRHF